MASMSISMSMSMSPKILLASKPTSATMQPPKANVHVVAFSSRSRQRLAVAPAAVPDNKLSEVVEKSIKDAEKTCAESPATRQCAAAWDEVEEVSAAASHARDKNKAAGADPLEKYCVDNPETDECRTYDN